jgi:prolyl oligopeptidase
MSAAQSHICRPRRTCQFILAADPILRFRTCTTLRAFVISVVFLAVHRPACYVRSLVATRYLPQQDRRSATTTVIALLVSARSAAAKNDNNNNNRLFSTATGHRPRMAAVTGVYAGEDPYTWLEEVESEESLEFARACNADCLHRLGNPEQSPTYQSLLDILESDDRIPHVSQLGVEDSDSSGSGEAVLFNFWKDSANPKGLWRKTTLSGYRSAMPEWTTVLDVDALAKEDGIGWVWKGSRNLPRGLDHGIDNGGATKHVTRALVSLSRGGSDAIQIREFDLTSNGFVTDMPFHIPREAKTRASYKSRNVLLVGSDFGPDSLTDSGYPRTVREWVRGTDLDSDAVTVFEGDRKDVSVSLYVSDERLWGGGIYEVRCRSLTFYTSKYWVRRVQYEHLLAPGERPDNLEEPPEFVQVQIQDDASIDFLGNMLIISLRSDWEVAGKLYTQGSVLLTDADNFLEKGSQACEYTPLFEPTERTSYQYYVATKNYLILSTMDTVKSKLSFFKIENGGSKLVPVGPRPEAEIRDCSARPVDPFSGSDQFWFTTSDFVTPSTLFLADATKMETAASIDDAGGEVRDPFIVEKLKSLPPQYDASNLLVEQRFATSKDGTEIPYFIMLNKDTAMDGKNPTLLYGYGGFEVSLGPHYTATAGVAWLERGGVYVEANIRGGGEFGPSWHQAGLKANRNKCSEDFIAVAEDLVASKICTPKTLAARGGSNVRLNSVVLAHDVPLWFKVH